jgi:hypothetical protein
MLADNTHHCLAICSVVAIDLCISLLFVVSVDAQREKVPGTCGSARSTKL